MRSYWFWIFLSAIFLAQVLSVEREKPTGLHRGETIARKHVGFKGFSADTDVVLVALKYVATVLQKASFVHSSIRRMALTIYLAMYNFERITDGLAGQTIVSILPCVISVDGIECQGLKMEGSISKFMVDAIKNRSNYVDPSSVRKMITDLLFR